MKTHSQRLMPRSRSIETGASIIEILVGLTIGLIVLTTIGTAYVNSTNLTRQREGQSDLNDPARIVLRQLRHDVNLAGYVDIYDQQVNLTFQANTLFRDGNSVLTNLYQRIPTPGTPLQTPFGQVFNGLFPVFGCDGDMPAPLPNTIALTAGPVVQNCGTNSATQQTLQLSYQASPATVVNPVVSLLPGNAATGEGRDCVQQNVPAANVKIVINRFYVKTNTSDGVNELMCAGSGNITPQPIARGVEEFVLRYLMSAPGVAPVVVGTNAPAAGNTTAQYLNATNVAADSVGWAGVSAVEICFVSASPQPNGAGAVAVTDLQPTRPTCARATNGSYAANVARAAGDQRLWKRFTAVVAMRNAAYSSPY